MKILYIGHYKEGTGWSQAAINNILALDSIGLDVVCKNINLTNNNPTIPQRILDLESKDTQNITHCIQHVLPHHLIGTSQFEKNVCYFVGESIHSKKNIWHSMLELVDEVWVPNTTLKNNLFNFLTQMPIKILPHTFDLNKYTLDYKHVDCGTEENFFKFYTIGDLNDRKNIIDVIKCYYNAFTSDQDVVLIMKIKKYGMAETDLQNYANQLCEVIYKKMRLYNDKSKYPKIRFITANMPEDFIYALHNTCDCFINLSHGEAWSIPTFESMCFGNTPICCNEGGPTMYVGDNKKFGTLVNGTYTICDQSDGAFNHIFTGSEFWFQPSHLEVVEAMQFYYNNRYNDNRQDCLNHAAQFSYESVANKIKEMLHE